MFNTKNIFTYIMAVSLSASAVSAMRQRPTDSTDDKIIVLLSYIGSVSEESAIQKFVGDGEVRVKPINDSGGDKGEKKYIIDIKKSELQAVLDKQKQKHQGKYSEKETEKIFTEVLKNKLKQTPTKNKWWGYCVKIKKVTKRENVAGSNNIDEEEDDEDDDEEKNFELVTKNNKDDNSQETMYDLKKYLQNDEPEIFDVDLQRAFLGFPLIYWIMGVIVVIVLILGSIYYFKDKLSPSQKGKKTEKNKKGEKNKKDK